ncbi:MAG: hypothetical protein IPN45_10635 [Actinomycetales bacterium]|nr:hypothetical protein [Actinomycetales bacterium]
MTTPRWLMGPLAAACAAAVGLSAAAPATAAQPSIPTITTTVATSTDAHARGVEIFRGLFFGIGPVASSFPELTRGSGSESAALTTLADTVVTAVNRANPGFFATFAAAMTSGKRVQVSKALVDAQTKVNAALSQQYGKTPTVDAGADCVFAFAVAVVTLVAAGNVAYAVNAVRTGNVAWHVNWFWSAASGSRSAIDQERWVGAIATTLRA